MRIGMSSWSCPWAIGVAGYPLPAKPLDTAALLGLAVDVGAEVLQIADNLPLHKLSETALAGLAGRSKESGVSLEVGTRGLGVENLHRYLKIAVSLGAHLVRTLPHNGADRPGFHEALGRLNAVKAAYERAGVMLAIENHDFYPARWLRDLVDAVASPAVGVCLDAVNNLGQGESFREVLGCLGGATVNFHCKDYTIRRKPTMLGFDVEGAPVGEGMLDFELARQTLPCGISWITESWLSWQGSIEATTKSEYEWLIQSLQWLKEFQYKSGLCHARSCT